MTRTAQISPHLHMPHPSQSRGRAWEPIQIALALLVFVLAAASAHGRDFQDWSEVDLTAAWHHVDLLVPFVARTDTVKPNPQLAATGLTADVHLPLHLTLTPGYLFADLPQSSAHVHIPLLALTGTMHLHRLAVADRNRLEGLIGYSGNPVRYRNRLLFDLPFAERAHLFLDDELFVNLSTGAFNQNRLQSGAGLHLTPRLLVDLYYLQKNPPSGAATHVLGSTLRIALTPPPLPRLPSHLP